MNIILSCLCLQHRCASPNAAVGGTFVAVSGTPQSADGSPASQYPSAPAASPVTVNSMVFNPPPRALVSSTAMAVCPTTASIPSQPIVMDRHSNPDSGYGSKIYRSRPAVDPVPSGQEFHLLSPIESDVNPQSRRVCSSFPDVVVDRPLYQVPAAAMLLPQTVRELTETSGRHFDGVASPLSSLTNLDLRTYSETNLVVSPYRGRRSRVPIELADDTSVAEVFSPMSPPLTPDSVDFVAEKVSDCMLSSPDNVPDTVSPLRAAASHRAMLEKMKYISTANHDEQLYYNTVNSVPEADNQHLLSRSLGIITEDDGWTSGKCDLYRKIDTVDSAQATDDMSHCQMVHGASARSPLIGRSTTV